MNIEKIPHLKIQVQDNLTLFTFAVLFKKTFHLREEIHQLQRKM